jgi:hypothetical protein
MDLHFSPKVAKFAFSTEMKLFIHARNSASFGGMYLVIRHHLANGFRRPCVFSCQMAIDSYQTTIDSHQTTMDSHQTAIDSYQTAIDSYQTTMDSYQTTIVKSTERRGNAPARGAWGGCRTRWGTARRAPTPYQQGQGEGGSTPDCRS